MKSIEWGGKSAMDTMFLDLVRHWIEHDGEVYVMYWFVRAAGVKEHCLFNSFDQFFSNLTSPSFAGRFFSVDVFRHPQFPIRGWVDNDFINHTLSEIQDGNNWFLIAFDNEIGKGQTIGAYGDNSHQALIEELNDHQGKYVIIGPDIHWQIPPDDYPGEWISAEMDNRKIVCA